MQALKIIFKIVILFTALFVVFNFFSCKKNKLTTDSGAKVSFSQDSILFDTVFTTIGSSTRNFRIRNKNNSRINISSIVLQGGTASAFKINVDGSPGTSFTDVEIAANDSIYVFVQVKVNPTNSNSPLIVSDVLRFVVNGNEQIVQLEAWGQDAYYHYPTDAIKFRDGSYLPYSLCDNNVASFTQVGYEIVWKKDKPHVIYGYCVVDSLQKLKIQAGTKIYLNYRASLWVFKDGQIQVLGQKSNEVIFQGARREKTLTGTLSGIDVDFTDEPGLWDRIWINEGSENNIIDYAIIKNGFIGIQAEIFGNTIGVPGKLTITNTKIQNMSKWGLYCLAYKVVGSNNVISNCQEHSLNLTLGGAYSFIHCTFANFWSKDKPRELATINVNNYTETQVIPINAYFGNCIIDGKLTNEMNLDIKSTATPTVVFSNSWIKTNANTSDANQFINIKKASTSLKYKDTEKYDFEPDNETLHKGFVHPKASTDAALVPTDIMGISRNTSSITAGAYESP